jgi:hypothetical protein
MDVINKLFRIDTIGYTMYLQVGLLLNKSKMLLYRGVYMYLNLV